MIENILGAENFKKGLNVSFFASLLSLDKHQSDEFFSSLFCILFQIYLEKHKYGNTDHDDLWESLNNVVPEELKAWDGQKFNIHYFASMWTEQVK